jgi:amidase
MDSLELAFTPAVEQADLIRRRVVSPLELTELYLARIEQLNPKLGAYVYVAAEQAIAEAKAKTEALVSAEEPLPPFYGVPISIKDLSPVAGMPCSYGVKLLKNRVAQTDDGIVTQIKQAGFVILGKTTTSQTGTLPYSEPDGFPPARNPWNLAHTPGGSSGGAAAALAAGLCAVSQGSDGGGSVRGPAFCCGLVGIKPSRGRVSHAPVGDRLSGIAISGPLGRTVADAAALLDVMSGYVPGDPYWLPDPEPSFLAATTRPASKLRLAMATRFEPIGEAAPICRQTTLDTATLLKSLGHEVEPIELALEELIEPFKIVFRSVLAEVGAPFFILDKINRWLWWRAQFTSCGRYLRAVSKMQTVARQVVNQLMPYDALLTPTYMCPAIQVGEFAKLPAHRAFQEIINWVAPCPPFNATGQPSIAVPTGFTPNGLPIGVQLVGRPGDEATIIALAAQLEAAQPWSHKRPSIANQPLATEPVPVEATADSD